jgi:RNA polymerase sigma-70 factor (ECF subfamily)
VIGDGFRDLLRDAQAGDEAAFARLVHDVHPALIRYLRVVSAQDEEDIASETWVSVVRGMARFRGDETAWRAWLFATARRRAVDEGRRRARRPLVTGADLLDLSGHPVLDPAEVALANLGLDAALDAIRRLPAAQAEVLMLRLVGGLPAATVAEVIGSTPGAVRVAAHRAIQRVAADLSARAVTP